MIVIQVRQQASPQTTPDRTWITEKKIHWQIYTDLLGGFCKFKIYNCTDLEFVQLGNELIQLQ